MITYVKRSNADKYSNLYEKATEDLMTHSADGMVVEKGSDDAIMPADGTAITSLEEYFSYIIELNKINDTYTVLPLDEEVFEIDANTRTISVPQSFASNGISVQGDEVSEIVYFKVDRFYDATDLATKKIYIQWTAPSGAKGVSAPWVIDIESEPNHIIFGWPLSSAITEAAGTVAFAVRFYSIDEQTEKISYSLSTLTQTATIKPSLDFDLENLATEGIDVDNASALITGRFENTVPTGSSAVAEDPIWLVDLNDDTDHVYNVDEEARTLYADLDLDDDGFRTVAFHANAQAITPDAGQLSYFWKGWNLDTGKVIEVEYAITMVETKDTSRVEGKLYYFKATSNGVESYKLYNGELDADSIINALGADAKVYEKMTSALINGIGKYQATAQNRVRNAYAAVTTFTMIVPRPCPVVISKDLDDSATMAKTDAIKTVLAVKGDITDKGKLTYEWFKKGPGEETFTKLDGEETAMLEVAGCKLVNQVEESDGSITDVYAFVDENNAGIGDGYYYCIITNNLNKETISEQSNTIRLTHKATAPIVEIVGDDAYTMAEIATDNFALEVTASIPEDCGEMVEGWRTADDTITYQWYRYYAGNGVLADDIEKAAQGKYEINHDIDLSDPSKYPAGLSEEEIAERIANSRKPVYDPLEAGYYFCVVTNTYNGTTASKISRFFSIANA